MRTVDPEVAAGHPMDVTLGIVWGPAIPFPPSFSHSLSTCCLPSPFTCSRALLLLAMRRLAKFWEAIEFSLHRVLLRHEAFGGFATAGLLGCAILEADGILGAVARAALDARPFAQMLISIRAAIAYLAVRRCNEDAPAIIFGKILPIGHRSKDNMKTR